MSKNKSSPIWFMSKEKLVSIINESNSLGDILIKIGLNPLSGGGYRTLKQRIERDSIDISKLIEKSKIRKQKRLIENDDIKFEDIFIEKSSYKSGNKYLKKILLARKVIYNRCSSCGITDVWNGKPLSLQLDHVNGHNTDNRIENLRLLCPNCHSQTITYGGKSKKFLKPTSTVSRDVLEHILETNTLEESARILHISYPTIRKIIKYYQIPYDRKLKRKLKAMKDRRFNVSKEELEKLVSEKPMTEIGKIFHVSDNAIKKRCRVLGINLPQNRRGYWQKIKAMKALVIQG